MDKLKKYFDYSVERALKTVSQVAIASIGANTVGVLDVDWVQVLSVSALAGIMSMLTSVLTYDRKPSEFDDFGNPTLRTE